MLENTYDECKICKEPIKKCYLTEGRDGNYYCAKCLIDLNRKIEYNEILKRRKIELKRQLIEIEFELEEERSYEIMYH
jgi:hypothetical protein